MNNRDVNSELVPETPACCHLITVPVPYNTLAAPSTPSLSSLHSPTHRHADLEGEIGRGTLRQMCSTSCTCLQIVVIFSVMLWSRLFDETPPSGFPCMIKSAFKRYTYFIWNRRLPCALTTATVGCFGVYQTDTVSVTAVGPNSALMELSLRGHIHSLAYTVQIELWSSRGIKSIGVDNSDRPIL